MRNTGSEASEEIALSNGMRFLMHYLGDVHQPLHCVSRVDDKYPAGDRGGNSFPTKSHYKTKELHAVWDKVLYEFHVTEKVPITDDDWVNQGNIAQRIMSENPESEIDPSMDPTVWAKESFEIASTFVYEGITEGDDLQANEAYITKGRAFAEKRIATGGYRLAKLLESMTLGVSNEEIKFLQM
jgi:hypothetical protein